VCPNGHHLTANEDNAGKTGKCPKCKTAVRIPVKGAVVSDSAVMSILGDANFPNQKLTGKKITPPKPVISSAGNSKRAGSVSGSASSSSAVLPSLKVCPNCEREIDMGYHICPHCHTYITGLNDF